jgi:hypothetical protein
VKIECIKAEKKLNALLSGYVTLRIDQGCLTGVFPVATTDEQADALLLQVVADLPKLRNLA